jgi:hypothetical protein
LAVECLGRVSNWSEAKREQIFRRIFSGQKSFDSLSLAHLSDATVQELPECQTNELSVQDVVTRAVTIHGRHLMKDISTGSDDDKNGDVEIEDSTGYLKFISVGSREADLIKIIEAIGENKPVLLEGPMGSGKTKLVEEVAKMAARCRIL